MRGCSEPAMDARARAREEGLGQVAPQMVAMYPRGVELEVSVEGMPKCVPMQMRIFDAGSLRQCATHGMGDRDDSQRSEMQTHWVKRPDFAG